MAKSKTKEYCYKCGKELTEDNCRPSSSAVSATGHSHLCLDCEQKMFEQFEKYNGAAIALYDTCMFFDVPCLPLMTPENLDETPDKWITYINLLNDSGKNVKKGNVATFADGVTNMRKIFGKDLTEADFLKYVKAEQARLVSLPGTEEQREKWGYDTNYTTEMYDALDRAYERKAAEYKGQTITPGMEDTICKVCLWNYMIDRYVKNDNIIMAQKLQTMVETALASEQMRKKDEKPVEALRIDALVSALENAGLMENGELLTYDELVEALRDKTVKSKKYDYSLDVADQVILDIHNSMRANADLALVTELPSDMELVDEYGEFEAEETENEIANKKYAGLAPVQFTKGGE